MRIRNGLIYFALLWTFTCTAQNVETTRSAKLYLKNGSILEIDVLRMAEDTLEFYRSDYPAGPVFVIQGTRIDSVSFKTGGRYVFVSGKENGQPDKDYGAELQRVGTEELLFDYQDLRKKSRGKLPAGFVLTFAGAGGTAVAGMLSFMEALFGGGGPAGNAYIAATFLSVGAMAGGIGLLVHGGRQNRRLKAMRRELEYRGLDPDRTGISDPSTY